MKTIDKNVIKNYKAILKIIDSYQHKKEMVNKQTYEFISFLQNIETLKHDLKNSISEASDIHSINKSRIYEWITVLSSLEGYIKTMQDIDYQFSVVSENIKVALDALKRTIDELA